MSRQPAAVVFLVTAVVTLTLSATHLYAGSLPAGAVSHWTFDETSGTVIHDVVGDNDGVLREGAVFHATSICGNAMFCDGRYAYALVPDDPTLDITDALTIEAWIRPFFGATSARYVVAKSLVAGGTGAGGVYSLDIYPGKVRSVLTFDDPLHQASVDGATTIRSSQWQHIAFTWDGATLKVFYNGQLDGMTPAVGTLRSTPGDVYLGRYGQLTWKGQIDEVVIYNRALSDGEIMERYESSQTCYVPVAFDIKPGSCPNPLNVKVFDRDHPEKPRTHKDNKQSLAAGAGGVLPVAILGTGDFDVTTIDAATLRLEGVVPMRYGVEDVAAPATDTGSCTCTGAGPDGHPDLTIKFVKSDIAAALGPVFDGDELPLTITGQLLDGTPIQGTDCVLIRGEKIDPPPDEARREDAILSSAIPNPFNPVTRIRYTLPREGLVTVAVYDVTGSRLAELVHQRQGAGDHEVQWDAGTAPSGVYFYRITAGDLTETRKLLLIK